MATYTLGDPYAPPPQLTGVGNNPYAAMQPYMQNPFGQQGWGQWSAPSDEISRAYFSKNPQAAIRLYSQAAGGSPGGNLEQFMQQLAAMEYDKYIQENLKPGGENLHFTDRLTPALKQQGWAQWQAQTPHQRGENFNLYGGAGRYS